MALTKLLLLDDDDYEGINNFTSANVLGCQESYCGF